MSHKQIETLILDSVGKKNSWLLVNNNNDDDNHKSFKTSQPNLLISGLWSLGSCWCGVSGFRV